MENNPEMSLIGNGGPRPRVSGVITSFNEEHNIGDCIESLAWCDEIIVVDSFSTDSTPEIAQGYDKVRFYQRNYFGAGAQKNWAMRHVRSDWIFLLDSDERCTPELRREVETLLADGPEHDAYMMNRDVYLLGKRIRYYAFRLAKYGYWNAAQCWRDGDRTSSIEVMVRPVWRFFRTYILQLGFLDGPTGIVFCLLQSYSTYMKFAILWGWQTNEARGIPPGLPEFDEEENTWEGLHEIEKKGEKRVKS